MTTDAAELDINVAVLPLPGSEKWKVRLTVLSGPDFRSPHARFGCICRDRETAERVSGQVVEWLQTRPPRLVGDRVVVEPPPPALAELGEGDAYPEV